jgi:hypothetical protein
MQCGLHFVDACRDWPRRATPFLCFAKESKQRKAIAANCPFRVPEKASGKGEPPKPNQKPEAKPKPKLPASVAMLFPIDPEKNDLEVRCCF